MKVKKKRTKGIEVLFEDNHLIAVNKPSGMLVQGDKTGDKPISDRAKEYLVKKYDKTGEAFIGVPHRIDRPTSGVLLLAKTSKALSRLNKMFQDREIKKTYWAVSKNKPPNEKGKLTHYLVRNPSKNKSIAHQHEVKDAKKAELNYTISLVLERYFLLEIEPITGRHHQIRSQLSAINCSIKGDLKYGFHRSNKDASIHLHARAIEFIHPVKKEPIKIIAPAPQTDPIWSFCNQQFIDRG